MEKTEKLYYLGHLFVMDPCTHFIIKMQTHPLQTHSVFRSSVCLWILSHFILNDIKSPKETVIHWVTKTIRLIYPLALTDTGTCSALHSGSLDGAFFILRKRDELNPLKCAVYTDLWIPFWLQTNFHNLQRVMHLMEAIMAESQQC